MRAMTGPQLHTLLREALGIPAGHGAKKATAERLGMNYRHYTAVTTKTGGSPTREMVLELSRRAGVRVVVEPDGAVVREVRLSSSGELLSVESPEPQTPCLVPPEPSSVCLEHLGGGYCAPMRL